jgi:hypothetical protein
MAEPIRVQWKLTTTQLSLNWTVTLTSPGHITQGNNSQGPGMCYKFMGVLKCCRQLCGFPRSTILCEVARWNRCHIGFRCLRPHASAALLGVVGSAMLPLAWGSCARLRMAHNFVNWTALGWKTSESSC